MGRSKTIIQFLKKKLVYPRIIPSLLNMLSPNFESTKQREASLCKMYLVLARVETINLNSQMLATRRGIMNREEKTVNYFPPSVVLFCFFSTFTTCDGFNNVCL